MQLVVAINGKADKKNANQYLVYKQYGSLKYTLTLLYLYQSQDETTILSLKTNHCHALMLPMSTLQYNTQIDQAVSRLCKGMEN